MIEQAIALFEQVKLFRVKKSDKSDPLKKIFLKSHCAIFDQILRK